MSYKTDWVIPNLQDMQRFCEANGLHSSAEAISTAKVVVEREINQLSRRSTHLSLESESGKADGLV